MFYLFNNVLASIHMSSAFFLELMVLAQMTL
jgi:hypothetical protein